MWDLTKEQNALVLVMTDEQRQLGAEVDAPDVLLGCWGPGRIYATTGPDGGVQIAFEGRVPLDRPGYPWSPWTALRLVDVESGAWERFVALKQAEAPPLCFVTRPGPEGGSVTAPVRSDADMLNALTSGG